MDSEHRLVRAALAVVSCTLALAASVGPAAGQLCDPRKTREEAGPGKVFAAYGVEGTFVVLNTGSHTCTSFNPTRAATRFLPASTFKIFNTMVALDEGSIPDAETVLKWDGVDRGSSAWNRDQNMRTAFRASTVWFYQELARRTGEERMRKWLERERYGNADPSGGIDRFWLDGGLRISANEQIDFLYRLYRGELDFSARAQNIANDILTWERSDEYVLKGKTGWTEYDGRQLGWLVGYVERSGNIWIYAMNFESRDPAFPMVRAREAILRQLLDRLHVLPSPVAR